MHDQRVALITDANQGIGLQIANELAAKRFTVLVGSRDLARGEEAARTIHGDARALQLDVTDLASIAAAAVRIRRELGRLDVLVNNVASSPARPVGTRPNDMCLDELRALFETNVFGVIAVTRVMTPLLRAAAAGRIVHVSSGAGSLTVSADPAFAWRSICGPASKPALEAMTLALAIELDTTGIQINPGTESVEEGARE